MGLFPGGTAALACLVLCGAGAAAAQSARLELQKTRYELRAGEPVPLEASPETVDFLLNAKSRSVTIDGADAGGVSAGPNGGGDQVLLAASLRLKPGAHTVTISATSATGEQRATTLEVVTDALPTVPNNATRPPVVLLNGWITGFTGTCSIATSSSITFGNLAQYLISDGVPVVYLFDNCAEDANQTIEQLGNDLGQFLNAIHYANGSQVPQIDLVAHSMGGLIARSYLAGLQPQSGVVLTPPAPTLVRKLVLIATPNFGSFVAGTYAATLGTGTQSAELIPASSFLWNVGTWNQFGDDLRGVDAIAVVGNAGAFNATVANASDGLVSETSAALGFMAQSMSTTRVVPYCHVDPATFFNSNLGAFNCIAQGIANVTDTNHLTGQIVRSFLAGTTAWKSVGTSPANDPYLSKDGGVLFGLLASNGTYVPDITQVQWGNVMLSIGGDAGTLFWDDMVFGSSTFVVTSQSLGAVTCPTSTNPVGFIAVTRCKFSATIVSVSPEVKGTAAKVVAAGAALTISGKTFGTSKCGSCNVTVTPTSGSSGTQTLNVSTWSDSAITVTLPASLTGLLTLTVNASTSKDSMNLMAISGTAAIAAAPTSLQFTYAIGGATPDPQIIAITNSGGGTLTWTATSSDSWLVVTPASDTAPSSLSVSMVPDGLSVGSYTGTIQISATGVSTPVSVPVTLTVTQAALGITPQTLTFQYSAGGSLPAAQNVSIGIQGSGTFSWSASDSDSWVSLAPASGTAPGMLTVSVNPANMAVGNYSSTIQITAPGVAGSPAAVTVNLVVQPSGGPGTITAVVNAASSQPAFASATWISIYGTNLTSTTDSWQSSSFVNGALPTSLDGVSVTINGQPAYVAYISPGQINVLAPDDATLGDVQVQVTSGQQQSNSFTVQKAQFGPAFFEFGAGPYVAALHADYSLVGAPHQIPGVNSAPAAPGEVILIYGTGFGPANPPLPTRQLVTTPSVLANDVQVSIGGVAATVQYAGLVGAGLYQLNVVVPQLPNGDAPVVATIGGVQTQMGALITVGQ